MSTTTEKPTPTAQAISSLLDLIRTQQELKTDAALARAMEVAPPVISKLRRAKIPFGPALILRLHEQFGYAVADIRAHLAGGAQQAAREGA